MPKYNLQLHHWYYKNKRNWDIVLTQNCIWFSTTEQWTYVFTLVLDTHWVEFAPCTENIQSKICSYNFRNRMVSGLHMKN